ncbi:P5 [Setosphaeria turcica polymycovirus 2]|nr:P5 [Setosphaeria turcica polymycovirus 2]
MFFSELSCSCTSIGQAYHDGNISVEVAQANLSQAKMRRDSLHQDETAEHPGDTSLKVKLIVKTAGAAGPNPVWLDNMELTVCSRELALFRNNPLRHHSIDINARESSGDAEMKLLVQRVMRSDGTIGYHIPSADVFSPSFGAALVAAMRKSRAGAGKERG